MLVRGSAGSDPSVIDDDAQVVALATAAGRFGAPESTGVTRVSYAVPASRPVMVEDVPEALAAKVVQEESLDFLYSIS